MGKLLYKKLFIAALVTSVAFGGFTALNFYIFKQFNTGPAFISDRRPPGPIPVMPFPGNPSLPGPGPINIAGEQRIFGQHPLSKPLDSRTFLINNILLTTAGVLAAWLLNILILSVIERRKITGASRHWVQYGGSYLLVIACVLSFSVLTDMNTGVPRLYSGAINAPARAIRPAFAGRLLGQLPLLAAVLINSVVIALLELIVVQHHKAQVELDNTQLKMKQLQARHQHLVHQLHPHFLFNSLSTLKALIKNSPDTAEDYLVRLSGFLRSSLTINTNSIIPLKDELELAVNYLDMQKMRFGEAFEYTLDIPQAIINSTRVPAFSLQLLVENAIKHNCFTVATPLAIIISYVDGYLNVENNKAPKELGEPSSSIGLKNLSERYQLASGNDIIVINTGEKFTVKIRTLKNEGSYH